MTSPSRILGADPGATDGGAALRCGNAVLQWWTWTWLPRPSGVGLRHRPGKAMRGVYRLRHDGPDGPTQEEVPTMADVATTIRSCIGPGVPLVLEMPYMEPSRPGRKVDPQDTVVLAEASGMLLGILGPAVARPLASVWRAPFGWAGLGADDAEARAVEWARTRLTWPDARRLRGLPANELGAVCEAAAIAAYREAA
jgi:hypothetical protein